MEEKFSKRIERVVEKGWITSEGKKGTISPFTPEQIKGDPVAAALGIAAGDISLSQVMEAFPMVLGAPKNEYSGKIVEMNSTNKIQYGIKTDRGNLPLPMLSSSIKNEMDKNRGNLGDGVIKNDAAGVYVHSLEIGNDLLEFGRDGKVLNRSPRHEIDI